MIQNSIIIIIVIACAWFIGKRFYNSLRRSQQKGGCDCSCSGCGPDVISSCQPSDNESDSN